MTIGFVYVLSNPAMPGLVKIGFSKRIPDARTGELSSSTAIPEKFNLCFWCLTNNPDSVEAKVHSMLANFRHAMNREFFRIEPIRAIAVIDSIVEVLPSRYVNPNIEGELKASVAAATPSVRACPKCGFLGATSACWICGTRVS